MAHHSSDLYHLIAALTATEKAYFKKFGLKYAQKHQDALALYQVLTVMLKDIRNQEGWEEARVRDRYKRKTGNSNLAKAKQKLYTLLMDSLREYERSGNVEEQIFSQYRYGVMLSRRGLKNQALEEFRKGLALTEDLDYNEFAIFINEAIATLESSINIAGKDEQWSTAIAQSIEIEHSLTERLQLQQIYYRAVQLQKIFGVARNEADKEKVAVIEEEYKAMLSPGVESVHAAIYRSYIDRTLGDLTGDFARSMKAMQSIVEIFEANEKQLGDQRARYLSCLDNWLQMMLLTGQLNNYEKHRSKLTQFEIKSVHEASAQQTAFLFTELIYHILDNKIEAYYALEQDYLELLHSPYGVAYQYRKVSFAYYFAFGFFLLGDYDKCFDWCLEIHQTTDQAVRYDIEVACRTMRMLILIKRQTFDQLESETRSLEHFLKSRDRVFEIERFFIRYAKKRPRCIDKDDIKALWQTTRQQLEEVLNNPEDAAFIQTFDIAAYFDSLIDQKDFRKLWAEKHLSAFKRP